MTSTVGIMSAFFNYDSLYDERFKLYSDLMESVQFTAETLPYNVINAKFKKVLMLEKELKIQLEGLG